ncbi:DMT family transporter [Motilimonas sp. KMU-193]|uniref:DMT family transporter n=1 Tax=Motilimonas sp. KMU-193 TaxID=3388668 RepID=UPI00396B2A2A
MPAFFPNIPLSARFMLLSALGFAIMSACVKLVSQYQIPVLEIVAARALVSLLLSYVDVRRKGISPWGEQKGWLFARGAVGALALICVYYSIATLPLAEATLLQYLHPVFTALIALLFLKEPILHSTKLCIGLSLVGLGIMISPGLGLDPAAGLPWFSILVALLGAFGSAVAYVIVRKLSRSEDSSVIIMYFPLIALPLSLLLLGDDFVIPPPEALLLLLFVGIFTQIGQVGLTKAMQSESASKATAYSYVQVLFSMLFGWLIFSELPSIYSWIGGGFILLGALINVLWKR